MARLPTVGGDAGNWGEILNDYLSQSHAADGSLKANAVGAPQLKINAVAGTHLQDGSVGTVKLQDGAVTSTKIDKFGQADGVATLDGSGKLPDAQLPALDGGTATDPSVLIETRRAMAAEWTTTNPVLAVGERGYESDTGLAKTGDGITAWATLAYEGVADSPLAAAVTTGATAATLTATYAGAKMVRGLAPSPLSGITVTALGSTARPLDIIDNILWGADGTALCKSTDGGLTWVAHGTLPAGTPIRIVPAPNGEMLLMTDKFIYKSSGFPNATQTWTLKVTSNGATQFQSWSIDGDGTRYLTTEYAAGGDFSDSRYARMTLDGGDTWSVVYDSVARYGAAAADVSHLHGCAYDPWSDRWYISEGHSDVDDIGGIYCSDDNGATWLRADGMKANPSPTVIVATDDGLVCSSDNVDGGIYGVVRTDVATQSLRRVWAWRTGNAGLNGFGVHGHRDPETGIVYFGYRTAYAATPPVIIGGTVTTGSLVWTWPNAFSANDDIRAVWALGGGKILAIAGISQVLSIIRGQVSAPTIPTPSVLDSGGVLGGTAMSGDSIAVGVKAKTGDTIRSLAAGVGADTSTSVQDGTALGNQSSSTGDSGTAVGAAARAHATGVAVGKDSTTGAFSESTAVGCSASTTSSGAVAIGCLATADNAATAVGFGAIAGTVAGSALGFEASAAGGSYSTALGCQTVTTRAFQTAIGPRSLLIGNSVTPPSVDPTAGGELYVEDGALKFRGSSGTVTVIAPA